MVKNFYLYMEKILYEDKGHVYIRESDGIRLMPVSTAYKQFNPTNWDHNVQKAAAQRYFAPKRYKELKDAWEEKGGHILDPKFIKRLLKLMDKKTFDRLCMEVQAEWKAKGITTSEAGTIEHAREEEEAILLGYSINPANGKEYPTRVHGKKPNGDNESVGPLRDLAPGFYPEMLLYYLFPFPIWSKTMGCYVCGIAGQSDKVYIDESASFVGDHKFTEKPLTDFSVYYKNFGKEHHTGPWSDTPITKISGYTQQLNFYGWMLEEEGFPPQDLRLHNHGQDIIVPYAPSRVSDAVSMLFNEGL